MSLSSRLADDDEEQQQQRDAPARIHRHSNVWACSANGEEEGLLIEKGKVTFTSSLCWIQYLMFTKNY